MRSCFVTRSCSCRPPIGIMPMKCTPDQYKRLMQERNAANREER